MPYANLIQNKTYQAQYRKKHRKELREYASNYRKRFYKILKKKRLIKNKQRPFYNLLRRIKQRCNDKNDRDYRWYGAKGIKCFLTETDIQYLWARDKAYLLLKPSIDRKDSKGHYTIENCQFIEHNENCRKAQLERWN